MSTNDSEPFVHPDLLLLHAVQFYLFYFIYYYNRHNVTPVRDFTNFVLVN